MNSFEENSGFFRLLVSPIDVKELADLRGKYLTEMMAELQLKIENKILEKERVIRNLSLAKLLSKMSEDSSGAERVKLKKVLDAVNTMGLSDVMLKGADASGKE